MAALQNGNLDCANNSIHHCDVNREIPWDFGPRLCSATFGIFIENFDGTKPIHRRCLDVFLGRGADVDLKLQEGFLPLLQLEAGISADHYGRGWQGWYVEDPFVRNWRPSILDFVFYFNNELFQDLAERSKRSEEFNRAAALSALRQGINSLQEYMTRDWNFDGCWRGVIGDLSSADVSEWKNRCLEILLAEQFVLSTCEIDRNICWETVQRLMELGVDVTRCSKDEKLASEMLLATARLITSEQGSGEKHGLQILRWLLDRGFRVEALALSAAVQDHGVAILECLAAHCFDLRKYGVIALAKAASKNNFNATKLLLDGGVDLNSTFVREHWGEISVFAAAFRSSTFEMTNKVEFIVEEMVSISDPSYPSAQLLEACLSRNLGPEERVQKDKIIKLLLEQGADVNAANIQGTTALISAAALGDLSTAFILLKHGARVNMVSSQQLGDQTALDLAAHLGRLDMVEFLLNANAQSASARPGGEKYDGAVQTARHRGHFVIAELICKHAADPCAQSLPTPEGDSRTANPVQTYGRLIPSEVHEGIASSKEDNAVSYNSDDGLFDSTIAGTKRKRQTMSGPETPGVSWTRVIEEVEDEEQPVHFRRKSSSGGKGDRTAHQHNNTWEASSGQAVELDESSGQNWIEDEKHDCGPKVSKGLAVDVFMGFSGSQTL
ncbi:hypothetical protein J7T55_007228 [Diaporthe amygdali]|uniref:uncharacterized protein n=1 Tax=Phomopsis amygdali TaxID=1214568 RepID=UPI0022FEC0F2|nr:uncharacterized protein J7T55_007228 [Diaporthe amygdali]KAJ0108109.1 hypothetical protein J7T55_007228 [Diaporthe amygdali]